MKCKYYGFHAVPKHRLIVSQGGNQCALVTESYAPCYMEISGQAPDLDLCALKSTSRATDFALFRRVTRVEAAANLERMGRVWQYLHSEVSAAEDAADWDRWLALRAAQHILEAAGESERRSPHMNDTPAPQGRPPEAPAYQAGQLTEVALQIHLNATEAVMVEYFPPTPEAAAVRITFSTGRAYTFDARTGVLVREIWPSIAAAGAAQV